MTLAPTERARKSAEAMCPHDLASTWFRMSLDDFDEGRATLSLTVAEHRTNGPGICHGGVNSALADSAFAFACNSHNQAAVAQHKAITYIAPAKPGDRLIAEASEVSLAGRGGLYDEQRTPTLRLQLLNSEAVRAWCAAHCSRSKT